MLTRKQRWRRTRTRKNAWGNLPPEVLDAMLAGGGGMPKSVSWDHSYAAGLKIRADAAAEVARRAAKEDSRLKAAAAAAAVRGGPIPRSVSCSSLAPKRTLFPRSNSKDELGTRPRRGSGPPTGRHIGRDMLPHRRGVSFDTQVKMVLIPKREEFSDAERIRLWWAREDYARFRQVLIDWKRANAHRISQSDNILSINLSDIDDDEEEAGSFGGQPEAVVAPVGGYNHDHDEAAAAADATAAAAAVAAAQAAAEAAKAMAAAAVTAQANAAATAAAAAAATAAEVAAMNAQEVERERQQAAAAAAAAVAAAQQLRRQEETPVTPAPAAAALPQQQEDESTKQSAADAWEMEVAVAKEMAAAVAAAGGGISGGMAAHGYPADDDGELSDISEGHEGQEDQDDARIGGHPAESASESSGANPSKAYTPRASFTMGCVPDWSSTGGANGTFPLRRALTFGETGSSPPSPGNAAGYGGRLKAVPLSEAQATAESLRAWRKNFDALYDLGGSGGGGGGGDGDGDGDGEEEEDRGRAMSLQQQTRNYAQRGRATALVMSRTKWASDVGGGGLPGSAAAAAAAAAGGAFGRPRQGEAGSGSNATGTTRAATAVTGGAASGGGGEKSGGCSVDHGVDEQQQQQQAGEKQLRNLSDQDERSVFLASPVMAAFERERAQAAAREAELEEARVARATAMVKAAMAEKLTSASSTAKPASAAVAKAGGGVGGSGDRCDGDSIVELGLNDAPGSAAAASAAGLRIATDGVSNLSLRSKDSVENLQELGEHSWGPLPLSSSA